MTQFDVKPMPHKQIIFVVSILVLIEKKMLYKRQKQFMNAFQTKITTYVCLHCTRFYKKLKDT